MTSIDVPGLSAISNYFDQFLPAKIGRLLLPDLRSLTSTFSVTLREEPRTCWALVVEEGVLTAVSQNEISTDCSFLVDANTLLAIVSGRLAPQQAFFQRRVDIGGDIAVGLKTAAVMAQFFRRFPFINR